MIVSVIVPIYNASAVLDRCIRSVLGQSYQDFELILIDDGSTDSSLEICHRYSSHDNRIKIVSQKNSGVSTARNTGIDTSTGDWITFLDSDDELTPNCLTSMVRLVEVDNQMICCSAKKGTGSIFVTFNDDGFDTHSNVTAGPVLLFGAPWGKLYNANIVKRNKIRFNTHIAKNEDTIFFWEYMQYVSKISTSSEIGYIYYVSYNPLSLHNKMVDPSLILQTRDILHEELNELKKKWLIDEPSMIELRHWLASFYIEALITVYRMLKPYSERKNIWKQIDRDAILSEYKATANDERHIVTLIADNSFWKFNAYMYFRYYLRMMIKKSLLRC